MVDKLAVKDRVSVIEDDETYEGSVIEVNGKECTIKFDGEEDPEVHRINKVTLVTSAEVEAQEAEAQKAADEQKTKEAEELKLAIEKAAKDDAENNIEDSISVPKSKVNMQKFKSLDNPAKMEAEVKRQEGLAKKRTANRIEKIKVAETKKPIDVRRDYLKAMLKNRAKFTKEQVNLMAKELLIIEDDPPAWKHGCVKAKKQPSALDKLDKVLRA